MALLHQSLGYVLILGVVVLWVGSSFLLKYLFEGEETSFAKPFFITYVNTTSFALFLVVRPLKTCFEERRIRTPESRNESRPTTPTSTENLVEDESEEDPVPSSANDDEVRKSVNETARIGLAFSVLWLFANLCTNESLRYTSVSSSTILSSLSSLFTYVFGIFFHIETFTILRLAAIATSIFGVALTVSVDSGGGVNHSIAGDILALFGAVGYGLYSVMLRKWAPKEKDLDSFLFFGFVGLFNFALAWPLFLVFHFSGLETFAIPNASVWGYIILNAAVGTLLYMASDYVWYWAVRLAGPTSVTVGLSLTIPLAMLIEAALGQVSVGLIYLLGASCCILGFVGVNWSFRTRIRRPASLAAPEEQSV